MSIYNFFCVNCTCGAKGKELDFSFDVSDKKLVKTDKDDISNVSCPNDENQKLKLMGIKTIGSHIDKLKHAKGRTPKEKESRRINDFIKNTLPKLPPEDKRHFTKKFTKKGYTVHKKIY